MNNPHELTNTHPQDTPDSESTASRARTLAQEGEPDKAMELYRQEMALYKEQGKKGEEAATMVDMAGIYMQKGQQEKAIELLEEASDIFRQQGELHRQADTLWDLGQIQLMRQDKENAIKQMKAGYDINLKIDAQDKVNTIGQTLGYLLCLYGNRDEGIPILERSLNGYKQKGMKREENQTQMLLMQMGEIHQ